MITTLLVFGATGDLAGRLLLPAVAAMEADDDLDPSFRFIGAGPQAWTTDQFTGFVREQLRQHAPQLQIRHHEAVLARVQYTQVDVTDSHSVTAIACAAGADGPVAVYLALPTRLMPPAIHALAACRLPAGSRVAVEKPFGHDTASAAGLNAALRLFDGSEEQSGVYRVDHALAMTAVSDLPHRHLPGTDGPGNWSGHGIAQIDVLWEETLALEGRASFYDHAGALRDVMQNHLLQVMCALAQAPQPDGPHSGGTGAAHDSARRGGTGHGATLGAAGRRVAVLRAIRPLTQNAVCTETRRARYTAGQLAGDSDYPAGDGRGRTVPDYADEAGVNARRGTETFAEVVLHIDNPQWRGCRFVLRAGKALGGRRRGVLVHLRSQPGSTGTPDPVWFDIDRPGGASADGSGVTAETADDVGTRAGDRIDAEPAAYRCVVTDLLTGSSVFAVSAAETELGWQVFEPVLQTWAAGAVPLLEYPAGSAGPR